MELPLDSELYPKRSPWHNTADSPCFCTRVSVKMLENPVSIAVHMQFDDTTDDTAVNVLEEEKGDNFDESSADDVEEESTLLEGEFGSSAMFLRGAKSWYKRALRFNN